MMTKKSKPQDTQTPSELPAAGLAGDFLKASSLESRSSDLAALSNGNGNSSMKDRFADSGGANPQEGNRTELVTFFLDKEEYGLPITVVQEINRVGEITEVPNSPPHVRGVINLRGKIVPVIELKRRLDLGTTLIDKNSRIVVVENGPKVLGLMVDRVAQVCSIGAEQIEETPKEVTKSDHKYIHGVGKIEDRMILLLELDQVVQEARE